MDISKQRLKSLSIPNMLTTIVLLLINTPMLYGTSNTFLIGEIECSCSGTSAVCSGNSEDGEEEIKDVLLHLLQNCSSTNDLLDLTLNINADKWPNISFKHFKLQNLTLGYDLEVLNEESFYGLNSSLSSLNLSHNDIEFFYSEHSPFSILENLKVLNLDYNDLTEFRDDIFENLTKLEVLSISGNSFTGLEANLLENMTVIQTLILDHNKKIFSFSNLNITSSTLLNLSLKNCSINGSLETDSLSGVTNLKYADFSSNKLIRVNAFALHNLHDLETLNLSNNKIETLKNYSFSSLHNLAVLDLGGNEISVIEEFSFVNLTQLKILNLADNKLYGFLKKYVADLYSLEQINLENNDIHYVESGSFSVTIQLKELLLQGNAFGCWHCDTMYIVGLLTNDTLFKKEDADAIKCAEPDEMKNIPVTEVTPEKLEDYCDPVDSTSETPSTIISTTDKIITTTDITLAFSTSTDVSVSNSSYFYTEDPSSTDRSTLLEDRNTSAVTTIIIPQSIYESTDTTYEATTPSITSSTTKITSPIIPGSTDATTEVTTFSESTTGTKEVTVSVNSSEANTTTELSSVFFTESEVTGKTETNTTTEVVTLYMPKITTERTTEANTEKTSRSTDTTTENEITEKTEAIEAITQPISEQTTGGNVGTSPLSTSELTTLLITERINKTTTPNTTEMTTSNSQFASTSFRDMDKTEETTIFVTVTQNASTLPSITTEPPTVSTGKTDLNKEEASQFNTGFVSTDALDYSGFTKAFTTTELPTKKMSGSQMIRIIDFSVLNNSICIRWDIKWEILSKQWIINELKCGVEIQHSTGKELGYFKNCPTSEHEILECAIIENKYLSNMYKFCLNVYISIFKKLRSCSNYDYLSTTEKSIKHSATTDLPKTKYLPSTQVTFVPFKVVKFDATFNYTKSFVDVNWFVNRNERNSICTLNLILMSHNFNYTEAVFSCKNNSYKIQNIKHEAFQVCLRNFYQGYYAPLMCKSSVPLPYQFKASSMKDDGYKNSALIAVICLLILIVLIVIVILLKKILKRRNESDLYNVSAEEKNVLRRQASASLQQEPCVRYSYTLREHIEI